MKNYYLNFIGNLRYYLINQCLTGFLFILMFLGFLMLNTQNVYSQCYTQPNYCTPSVTNSANYNIGIQNVTLSTSGGGSSINNTSVATGNTPHYYDYTDLVVSGAPGSTVSGSVRNGTGNSTQILIFVDWNRDGTFGTSAPELVWTSPTTTVNSVVSVSFTISSSQAPGIYRMRVAGTLGSQTPTPCQSNYGEFEDYTLVVTSSSSGDAAAFEHTSPLLFNTGNNTIAFSMINLSNSTMSSVDIGYQLDNNTAVTQSISGLSIASGAKYTATFSTALNISNVGNYDLKVWLNNVNNQGTQTALNDTICKEIIVCDPLSGNFTIGSSGDYSTITAAVNDLLNCGVNGAVEFTIQTGTYNETINVQGNIPGASSNNTITFDGVNKSNVTLISSSDATISVSGASWITFKNMTINNTTSNPSIGFHLSDQAENISIFSNNINVSTATSANNIGIAVSSSLTATGYGNNANQIYIEDNNINGGYYGIAINGTSTASNGYGEGVSILNNTLRDNYLYGIRIYYFNNVIIHDNDIDLSNSPTNSYAAMVYYVNNSDIQRNTLIARYMGLYLYYNNSTGPNPTSSSSKVINNKIEAANYSTCYALYAYYNSRTDYIHNSVHAQATSTSRAAMIYHSGSLGAGSRILNNIFYVSSGTNQEALYNNSSAGIVEMDYNVYYTRANTYVFFDNSPLNSLEALQNANTSLNQNSIDSDLGYSTGFDFDHDNACLIGKTGLGVTEDVYNNARNSSTPTIGCVQVSASLNYDLALEEWIAPLPIIQPGDYDIVLAIRNYGNQTITSANVSYQVNNDPPKTQNWTGSLSNCEIDTVRFTGSDQHTFSSSEPFTDFKAYTANPNNQNDQNLSNDTLDVRLCLAISGTYSIDPTGNGDFVTFTEAVNALNCGISGPVEFIVEQGTYNETIELSGMYPGLSSTNTIKFTGRNKTNVVLTSSEEATVTISGTNWVTFDNMTINNTTSGPSIGFLLNNQADYVTIKNTIINVSTVANTTNIGIASSSGYNGTGVGNNANYLLIENNEIYGGYYGITLNGVNLTSGHCVGNKIINNKIENQYLYGLYIRYMHGLTILNNKVDLTSSASNSYSHYLYGINDLVMENNQLHSRYGFYFYYLNYYGDNLSQATARIVNNMISYGGSTYAYGYLYYANNVDFYHNSLYSYPNNNAAGYGLYLISANINVNIKNNIIASGASGVSYLLYMNSSPLAVIDHNVYFTSGNNFVYWNNSVFQSLSAWQNAFPLINENSFEEDPEFLEDKDLKIPDNKIHLLGDHSVPVSRDIFGTDRCFYMIGAYEVSIPVSPPKADFLTPDTAYVNSPVLFLNNPLQGEPQYDQWFVDGVFVTNDRDMEFVFNQFGVYEITLVAGNCTGDKDTAIQTITIVLPIYPPLADFIADKIFVARNQNVGFTDMSTMGPSQWQWNVSPDQVEVFGVMLPSYNFREGTNSQSKNPVISFLWPGLYSIELTATNNIGSDMVVKTEYISVGYNLCPDEHPDFISSSEPKGLLFDDGGTGLYSGNKNCNFVIDPCVDTLFLVFDKFELRCGEDFLRIWDGTNSNGKPMHCLNNNGPGFTGGNNICEGNCLPPDTLILLSGQAYIEFRSEPGTGLEGFRMRWFTADKQSAPNALFSVEDTICASYPVNFENVSTGSGLKNYSWHYGDSDPLNPSNWENTLHGNYTFNTIGDYTISLAIEDCEGLFDTAYHLISVVNRDSLPVIDFIADDLQPMAHRDIVTFDAIVSGGCNDTYAWRISPSRNIRFVNGTDSTSRNPQVLFEIPACYDVELYVSNATGTAIETKACYITAWDYCKPYVNTDIASPDDIGISHVSLGDINNHTQMGEPEKYKNFSYMSTSLERGQTYTLRVERSYAQNPISWAAWIDYDQSREFDAVEILGYVASSNDRFWNLSFKVPGNATLGDTRLRIGTNYANQIQRPCGPHAHGEFHDYTVVITSDITPPVITLVQPATVFVQVFNAYVEPGYSAWDDADGDITSEVAITSNVDTSNVGVYQVIYDVSDISGNTATAQRDVIVIDTIWPDITLLGDDTLYFEVHDNFIDPGFDIEDNYWQNIQPDITSTLDMNNIGTYSIQYCVTDGSGNGPVCKIRIVIIEDNTPPLVELIGEDTVIVEVYNDFVDPWLLIEDNYWGDNNLTVVVSGTFENTDTLDIYYRTYTVTDGSGNSTSVTRYIRVVDTTPPVITLIDSNIVIVNQWDEFVDPWIIVSDNFDEVHHIEIFTEGNFTGTQMHGLFFRSYYAIDRSGNISEVKNRTIYVEPAISVEQLDENDGFGAIVFPNPSSGLFNLNVIVPSATEGTIMITDMLGREIKTIAKGTLESQVFEIDMSNEASGIYLIRVETSDRVMIERINIAR